MSKHTIALVGGTGRLGTLIGNAVLDKPDVHSGCSSAPVVATRPLGSRRGEVVKGGRPTRTRPGTSRRSRSTNARSRTSSPSLVTFSTSKALSAYESGSGKKLRVERLGSLEELDARIDQLKKADPANFLAYLPLMYYRSILNGEGSSTS